MKKYITERVNFPIYDKNAGWLKLPMMWECWGGGGGEGALEGGEGVAYILKLR